MRGKGRELSRIRLGEGGVQKDINSFLGEDKDRFL